MKKYTIGIDYGTLSGRAVLVDVSSGEEVCASTLSYPHGVMSEKLPDGTKLPQDFALQHPQDYLDVLHATIPDILKNGHVSSEDVIGVGIDFTASTVLPVKKDGTPLCFLKEFERNPHAYVKLWKHHAAQDKANRLNQTAAEMETEWLTDYGGKTSSEWLFPKLWETLDAAPEVYAVMDAFVEAGDWVTWQLCGSQSRNICTAGYKALWNERRGYLSGSFLEALDKRLGNAVSEKLGGPILPLGEKTGELTVKGAELTGLKLGTPIAVSNVDAHVTVPAVKIGTAGKMLGIIGTSTCHMLLSEEKKAVPGICGVVKDGILPGQYGYEAGQCCVGDLFAWFIDNCLPASYLEEAACMGLNIHELLREKAKKLKPGESGLVALDWWNGNRSVLVDADLTGAIIGMTILTKPEEIYRALIEATAYGTRKIIETFRENGVPVDEFYASGGIAKKDAVMMQIYADVIGMPVYVSKASQGPALGSAMFAAVAAGKERGGYNTIYEAIETMGAVVEVVYHPNRKNISVYDKLYREYCLLHDYFGGGSNDVMKRLKKIKAESKEGEVCSKV